MLKNQHVKNDLRILVIDDNPDIHRDFITILTANSNHSAEVQKLEELDQIFFGKESEQSKKHQLPQFIIDTASQGQEGLEKIDKALKEGKPYALAFVDVRMPPGWDGIETIKHIWELDQDIQIVICTAYSDYSWEETVEELGEKENLLILKKPFDSIAVRQLSCALTKKWQLLQESHAYTQQLEKSVDERTQSLQKLLSVTRGTLESSIDAIVVIDKEGKIIDYNQKIIDMWNITPSIIETKDATILFTHIGTQLENSDNFLNTIKQLLTNFKKTPTLKNITCKDHRIIEHDSQLYKMNDAVEGRVWNFRDITDRAKLEEKVQYQATHDMLTGLPNRVLITDRILQLIMKAKREKVSFGILFFDLDRFKLINDSFSHEVGDELLQAFAKRVRLSISEVDTLARLGGDEFIGLVTNIQNEDDLIKIANNLLLLLTEPFFIANHQITVSSSIGISIFPKDGETTGELLRNADIAMYLAKELGGKQFQFYTAELNTQNLERLELEIDLYKAIENNEFFLCYQPQFNLKTKELISIEALIRWNHPNKGLILPIVFIPLAEEVGLITAIGDWVIRTACQQNKKWQEMGLPKIRVAVNIATQQFRQPDLVNKIESILQETGLEAKYLELELTENVIISSIESVDAIYELKNMGISIALDDFGTGYSSMNYLRKIPLDRIKIDQSFIQNIDINSDDEVIIQSIIMMAKNLNLEILAEGVETKNQLEFLKSKNCGEVQGFYFSKPLLTTELEEFLKNPIISAEKLLEKK